MKDRADESSWRWWVRWKVFAEWGRLVWMWFLGGKGGIGVKVFHWPGGMVVGGSGSAESSVAQCNTSGLPGLDRLGRRREMRHSLDCHGFFLYFQYLSGDVLPPGLAETLYFPSSLFSNSQSTSLCIYPQSFP